MRINLDRFIAKHLTTPAGFGGRVVSFFMNRQNRPLYEEAIRVMALANGENILDIGCGNGYVLNIIAKRYNGTFTGIDISESIINAAKKRNEKYIANGTMTLACQDLRTMDFADSTFSKAYTINTVYFWDSLDSTMNEIKRVLKPGGIFINTLYSNETLSRFSFTKHGYKRYTQEQLIKAGIDAGFEVEVVPILKENAFCYLYRKQGDSL